MTKKKEKEEMQEMLIGGTILIILGLVFLTGISLAMIWPLFILVPAVMLWFPAITKKDEESIIPAIILTIISLMFFSITTGLLPWNSMTWMWPLFILGPGLGLLAYSQISRKKEAKESRIPGMILTILASIFLINTLLSWNFWPLLLIILGIIIIINYSKNKRGKK